jgi:osmotically-inducible protein OsmY
VVAPRLVVLVVVLALAGAGCARTANEAINDTLITARVKTAILNDPTIDAVGIDVRTVNGVVTLSGGATETGRIRVIAIARGIDDVVEVIDALQVTSTADPQITEAR